VIGPGVIARIVDVRLSQDSGNAVAAAALAECTSLTVLNS
jgi:hypothetical protein